VTGGRKARSLSTFGPSHHHRAGELKRFQQLNAVRIRASSPGVSLDQALRFLETIETHPPSGVHPRLLGESRQLRTEAASSSASSPVAILIYLVLGPVRELPRSVHHPGRLVPLALSAPAVLLLGWTTLNIYSRSA